ncbi:MAG: metal ABC transporter ATP-binding protein [Sphingobacterium sp.]
MIIQSENPVLEVHDLTVSYSGKPALWSVDFSLPGGSITGIIGPNGSGKSTLLKSIMGLIPLSSGYVKIFGKELDDVRSRVSYVPQRETVDWDFPVSALDVVLMGRYAKIGMLRNVRSSDRQTAMECLEKVGMAAFAKRQISQLSGGQQQRVFIARALAQEADFYLMDEPFAGVDAATEEAIITLLREMVNAKKNVIVVHHNLDTITEYFDWLVMLNMRLVASGPVKQVYIPELLKKTYGTRLSVLAEAGDLLAKDKFSEKG